MLIITGPSIDPSSANYLRFSSISYNDIEDVYGLSNEIISAIFTTALLNAIGTNIPEQQIIDCAVVPRLEK